MDRNTLNEAMLDAWLRLSTALSNERIVKSMPYKEALICNILDQNPKEQQVTATELCRKTKMLKSQMNRTLNDMEERGLIIRERSTIDKRKVFVRLNPASCEAFREEHQKNLQLVDCILGHYGREKAENMMREMNALTDAIEEVLA